MKDKDHDVAGRRGGRIQRALHRQRRDRGDAGRRGRQRRRHGRAAAGAPVPAQPAGTGEGRRRDDPSADALVRQVRWRTTRGPPSSGSSAAAPAARGRSGPAARSLPSRRPRLPRPFGPARAAPAPPGLRAAGRRAARPGGAARARNLEFNEPSFFRALSEADAEAVRAYLDAGMSAKHVFVDTNRRSPLMILSSAATPAPTPSTGARSPGCSSNGGPTSTSMDAQKNTALMFAADRCDRETLRLLIKVGRPGQRAQLGEPDRARDGHRLRQPRHRGADRGRRAPGRREGQGLPEAYKNNPRALALIKKASAP